MSLESAKERILLGCSLPSLIGETIRLETRSGRKVGLCPFHEEKSPSFTVYDDHYFCFGCRAHGDAITFVRKTKGLGFIDALKYLASKCKVDCPELEKNEQDETKLKEAKNYYAMHLCAHQFFVAQITAHPHVYKYVESRGFGPEKIKLYGFGYAPKNPDVLLQHLKSQGFKLQDADTCSLATHSQTKGRYYPFFQDRLMIPIRDALGRIVGFGGRAMDKDNPAKYKNSRETFLFDKSKILFGFDRAKEVLPKAKSAIVTEGYMDALQLWNNGIENAVACLGTALTQQQLGLLSHSARTVYLVFDGDEAGKKATLRSVNVALHYPDLEVKVCTLTNKEDPDSFVRQHGREGFLERLDSAQSLLDFAIQNEIEGAKDLQIPQIISQKFVPWLKTVRDSIQRSFLIGRICEKTLVDYKTIEDLILDGSTASIRSSPTTPEATRPVAPAKAAATGTSKSPTRRYEYELLAHLFYASPEEIRDLSSVRTFVTNHSAQPSWHAAAEVFCEFLASGRSPSAAQDELAAVHPEETFLKLLKHFEERRELFLTPNRPREILKLMNNIKLITIRSAISDLKDKLRATHDPPSESESHLILKAIRELNHELILAES
ncbi:MAG: DNA primase [Oligoflexales bacterium]